MRFRDIPVRQKLMTALLLTSGVVLLLACVAFITYEVIALRRSMVESYATRARIIAANSSAALAFQNVDDATEVLGALKTDPKVTAACLYDGQGRIFAKYPAGAPSGFFPAGDGTNGYHSDYLETFCPVLQGERKLGTVYVRSDLSALTDRYRAYAWLVMAVIAGSVLTAYLLSRALQGQISVPVLALAGTARAITKDQDFSTRAQKFGEDELGVLTDAFNRMLGEIETQNQALKRSEERFRALIENSQDGIAVSNSRGEALYVSPALTRMLGRPESDFTGKSRPDLIHPDDLSAVVEKMAETLRNPGKVIQVRYRLKHQDGSWRWIEMTATNLLDNPAVGGIIRNIRDITEQLKIEEITKNQDFVTSVIENVPNMIFVKDAKDLRFIMFNKAGEDLIGVPKRDLMGKNDYDFFPRDQADFFTAKDRKVINDGKLLDIPEEPIDTKVHGPRVLHTRKIPIQDKEGKPQYLLGISEDITELKRQQELKMYTQALEVSNKELQDFVFIASHDLQEPLRKIQSFGEFLQEEYSAKLEETGRDYLQRMRSAAGRMQALINDLLALTRVTTKAKPFEPTDLSQVLKDVLSDLEVRIQEKKAKVEVGPLPTLEADATQMRQLFQNLIGNALKFQRDGFPVEIKVKAVVLPGGRDGKRLCSLTVEDNGIGFDNKYAEQIFKIFERLHGKGEYEGTGIGLAICRKVVERHGGRIWAESNPGKGSLFTVELPLQQG